MTTVTDSDYSRLLAVRTRLRAFEQWSADQAAELGLTSAQHQLLLAIRGHTDPRGPTIGQVANYLLTRHHTAVELVNRTQQLGLVTRVPDDTDHRVVRLALTADGRRKVQALSSAHIEELARLSPLIQALISDLKAT